MSTARGFTTLEILLAASLFLMISTAVFGIAMVGQDMYVSSGNEAKSSSRAHGLTGRLVAELRHASIAGEDVDEDNDPDDLDEEDTNGNGVIDDDWSLGDGSSARWISFNKVGPGGNVSGKITIRFDGKRVYRDYQGKTTILAEDVRALTFTRSGKQVEVSLYVRAGLETTEAGRLGGGMHLKRSILLRN